MTEIDNTGAAQPSGISRRTVNKAMAWSVPAVAVAASAPAFAASPGFFELDGRGCKLPGNATDVYKGYAFGVSATNSFNDPVTITITSLFLGADDLGDVLIIDLDTCTAFAVNTLIIPGNTTLSNLVVLTQNAANSANGTLTVTYDYSGATSGSGTESQFVSSVPPIVGGSCDDFTAAEKACVEGILVP